MINMTFPANAGAAIGYYGRSGTELEQVGEWQGKEAEKLSLTGPVDLADWRQLVQGHSPDGDKLAQRIGDNRRCLIDITISANKPTAILAALYEPAVFEVLKEANRTMMELAEQKIESRVKGRFGQETVTTGAMISAPFHHAITRSREPGWHTHNTVIALTGHKGKYYAPEFDKLVKSSELLKAVFHNEAARGLRGLGFDTYRTKDNYGIRGIPDSACRTLSTGKERIYSEVDRQSFSLDRQIREASDPVELRKIEARIARIKSPQGRAGLAKLVREKKQRDLDLEKLEAGWLNRLTAEEQAAFEQTCDRAASRSIPPESDAVTDADRLHIKNAMNSLMEKYSRVAEETVLTVALKSGVGEVTLKGLQTVLDDAELVRATVDGVPMVQTWENRQKERELLGKPIVWLTGKPEPEAVAQAEKLAGANATWIKDAGKKSFAELHRLAMEADRLVIQGVAPKNAPDGHPLKMLRDVGGKKPIDDKPLPKKPRMLSVAKTKLWQQWDRMRRVMHYQRIMEQDNGRRTQQVVGRAADSRQHHWER